MKKGIFIVIDGTDGSGKATQAKLLTENLKKAGFKTKTIDFPRYENNFFGKMVGRYLSGEFGSASEVSPYLASILYACDRFESKNQIENWLKNGFVVIADRYASSNQIHQGGKISNNKKRVEFLAWLEELEYKILKIPRPQTIFYLDMPLEISQKLLKTKTSQKKKVYLKGKKDIHENDPRHLRDAKNRAIELVRKNNNWTKIDCAKNGKPLAKEEINQKIMGKVVSLLS